jgi:hypothetical protein
LDYYLWWIGKLQPSRKISNNEIGKFQLTGTHSFKCQLEFGPVTYVTGA